MATYRNHPASGIVCEPTGVVDPEAIAQSVGGSAVILRTGGTMARPATTVWAIPDGASTLPDWGARWNIERVLLALAEHLREAWMDLKECFVTERLFRPKKGASGDQTRQRHQNHGHCRQPWSSSRLAGRKCFAG